MKHALRGVVAGIAVLLAVQLSAGTNAAKTALHIEGMTCGSCATAVKNVLSMTSGVMDATVSYAEKRADVTFDPAETTPQKIAGAIADALNYQVTVLGINPSPVSMKSASPKACADSKPPAGKPIALASYRIDELRNEFNRASDRVRVVALLSPTCGACQSGQRVVQSVFTKFSDPQLRGFVVWLPMLSSDDKRSAEVQAGAFTDPRVTQRWDKNRDAGVMLARTLKLNSSAWDVYLLYAPGVKWTGDAPPPPSFWMHQLKPESGADQSVCLNPGVMTAKVDALLRGGKKG